MANEKLNKYFRFFPKIYNVESNPVINALIQGFAQENETTATQLENTKAQLFIKTAGGTTLNKLAASLGVSRPGTLGLSDDSFRELVPNLSLKHKNIRKTFYDTMDIFWGPTFSRSNVQTVNFAPFNISAGDEINVIIDNGTTQEIKVLADDIATPGAATAEEIVTILDRLVGSTAEVITDSLTGNEYINLRTNSVGIRGSIEIEASSGVGTTKLDLEVKKHELWQQPQRTVIYNINPNELVIEIPAIVPALKRTLIGSHHFHADSTLESAVAPDNGIWQGSFLFDSTGITADYTVTGQKAKIQEVINEGSVYTKVTVDDASGFLEENGELVFGWGTDLVEQPVKYRGIPNSNTVLLDPTHIFANTHSINSYINVLSATNAFTPSRAGTDFPVYLTSPSGAREIIEGLLAKLTAAGVLLTFVILAPDYKYMIDNPYLSSDDAPGV